MIFHQKLVNYFRINDLLTVNYYTPYFINGKEYLVLREVSGLCVGLKKNKFNSFLNLKMHSGSTEIILRFNLRSCLINTVTFKK